MKKYIILNNVSEKCIALTAIQFSQCDISIHTWFLIFLGTGSEVLTVVKIHNVVWFGHCIVWYMVMNALEEHSVVYPHRLYEDRDSMI